MPTHDVVVIGASAGGLQALEELVALFPRDLPAAILVVQHFRPDSTSQLAQILGRSGPLPAVAPVDGAPLEPGRIYTARPDHHMLVERDRIRIVRGPRENRHRPAADPLFRSAAWAYGPRVVGVVLSGYLDDGAAGLWAIRSCGGIAVVQHSSDAMYPDMPRNAALAIDVDYTLPVSEIGPLLVRLAGEEVDGAGPAERPASLRTEIEFAKMQRDLTDMATLGPLSPFTCPSCRGSLWEIQNGDLLRYRCHTGHAFSMESLLTDQTVAIEQALYSSLRAVEEKATALRRLADRHQDRLLGLGDDYRTRAAELDRTADVIRDLLAGSKS